MRGHGTLIAVGVEGTGAYGAERARVLTAAGITVLDVDRPDRRTRRMRCKSNPIDTYAAATAVASGRATGIRHVYVLAFDHVCCPSGASGVF